MGEGGEGRWLRYPLRGLFTTNNETIDLVIPSGDAGKGIEGKIPSPFGVLQRLSNGWRGSLVQARREYIRDMRSAD